MKNYVGSFSRGLLTMAYTGTLAVGQMVKMSANGTVVVCENNNDFIGQAKRVDDDNYCGVEMFDLIEAEYSGDAPSLGKQKLITDADAKVKKISGDAFAVHDGTVTDGTLDDLTVDETGVTVMIVEIDTTNTKVYFFIMQ